MKPLYKISTRIAKQSLVLLGVSFSHCRCCCKISHRYTFISGGNVTPIHPASQCHNLIMVFASFRSCMRGFDANYVFSYLHHLMLPVCLCTCAHMRACVSARAAFALVFVYEWYWLWFHNNRKTVQMSFWPCGTQSATHNWIQIVITQKTSINVAVVVYSIEMDAKVTCELSK